MATSQHVNGSIKLGPTHLVLEKDHLLGVCRHVFDLRLNVAVDLILPRDGRQGDVCVWGVGR